MTDPGEQGRAHITVDATFAIVPTWLLNSDVSAQAIRLYAVLHRYADSGGACWPGRRLLAKRLQARSTDTVDRALRELVAAGAVTVESRYSEAGAQTSSLYRVHVTPPGGAANLRLGGRTSAAGGAAPVRHITKAIELKTPPTPAAAAAGAHSPHHQGQHRRCRACGTAPRQLAEQQLLESQRRPDWCGACDPDSRTIEVETQGSQATVARCRTCHPKETRS